MAPSLPSVLYCTADDLDNLYGSANKESMADDDGDEVLGGDEPSYLSYCAGWGTEKVNFYCSNLYPPSRLATSWWVYNQAIVCASYILGCRRGNPPVESVEDLYLACLEDMKLVHSGKYQIPNLAPRSAAWPSWSSVRVDPFYNLRKIRVQRPVSDRRHTDYRRNVDWRSEYTWEW